MVNGLLVFGSGKLCNSCSKPRKPRLGQFSSVILTRHRPSQPGFSLHSSLASSFHMPPGQFSTRTDSTWAPCLRLVDTPCMPNAFWANCQVGNGPPRVLQLTPGALQVPGRAHRQPGGSTQASSLGSDAGTKPTTTMAADSSPTRDPAETGQTPTTPTAADSPDLGRSIQTQMSYQLKAGWKRLVTGESRWWLNGVVGPSLLLTGLVFAQQTVGVQRIEVLTLEWRRGAWD